MRLWHKDSICVLPREQLISSWRELSAIAGSIQQKGTPNHILVNRIMDYHLSHFYKFCSLISGEMHHRGFKVSDKSINKIMEITDQDIRMGSEFVTQSELFAGWHDERYLKQCYYNLQEKYDCGGISKSDWDAIETVYNNYFL